MPPIMKELGFIIFFLVMCLVVQMTLGKKVLFSGLVVVLLSMVLTNWAKIQKDVKGVTG